MKNGVIALVVVLVVVGGGVIVWANHNKSKPNQTTSSSSSSSTSNMTMQHAATSSNQSAQATDKVVISNFSFSPSAITVKQGTTVTWTNQDSVAHNVTETDGQNGPKSQNLSQGQSYSFTFNTAGTFHYHCSIHPDMTGTVTVTQ